MRGKGLLKKLTAGLLAVALTIPMAGTPKMKSVYASEAEIGTTSEIKDEIPTEEETTTETAEDAMTETEENTEEETFVDFLNPEADIETPGEDTEEPQADGGFIDAQWISVNQRVTGSGNRFFAFTIDKNGYFTLNFQHPMVDYDYGYWKVNLYDENQQYIKEWDINGYNRNFTTCRFGYPKGSYYIEIVEKQEDAPGYSLCVNFTQTTTYETEYNNTFTTANPIKLNTTYGGNLFYGSLGNGWIGADEDYYKFTLSKAGCIKIAFRHAIPDDTYGKYWKVDIYNSNQTEIYHMVSEVEDTAKESTKIGLGAGTYYIKVYYDNNSPSDINYTLKVTNTYTNVWETELNDTRTTADSIKWGTTYYGTLKENEDEDYYTFQLTSRKETELIFQHAEDDNDSRLWNVKLMDVGGNTIWEADATGNKTSISSGILKLAAGKYYIRIARSYVFHSEKTYNFRIQTPTIKVSKIKLNKSWVGLDKGKSVTLKATVSPSNANNKAVTWTSSNSRVATVSFSGKVIAKASGTATITCSAKDGSGKRATCKITVYNNTQAYVARIYTKALGRNAERDGLNYWTEEIQYGFRTPVEVAEEFFFAPEFTNKRLSNTEYVKVLYRTFMGREYDQAGLNYWVGRLNRGESRKSVLEAFAGCPEFRKIVKSFGL